MQSIAQFANCADEYRLIDYLQRSAEADRASLSRELHDELGGLLVSVIMDIGFVEQTLPINDGLRQRLSRVRHTLAEAIDLKRKIIENLRPSMLDNFGLFQALKWEIKQRRSEAHMAYSEIYPEEEPKFSKEASIALFRIGQEFLKVALQQRSVTEMRMAVSIEMDTFQIAVSHDGQTVSALTHEDTCALCSIAHRVRGLGGELTLTTCLAGGAIYSARLPLARITTSA